ncbi:MAG: S26 family signal peptidase [Myxococcales bacterium]|nr:S26 family signal peptidase [Myxococcales bacterium]
MSIAAGIAVLLIGRASFADHYRVPSGSMEPNIDVGDRILVNKLAFGLRGRAHFMLRIAFIAMSCRALLASLRVWYFRDSICVASWSARNCRFILAISSTRLALWLFTLASRASPFAASPSS